MTDESRPPSPASVALEDVRRVLLEAGKVSAISTPLDEIVLEIIEERDALIAAAKGMAKELRDEQRRADELAEKLAVERRVWCDKPEDRLYHAADRTWWMRHPKTLRPVGADPPPLEVTEAQFAAALHAFCMVYWGHHDLDTKATGVDAALAAAFTAAGGA